MVGAPGTVHYSPVATPVYLIWLKGEKSTFSSMNMTVNKKISRNFFFFFLALCAFLSPETLNLPLNLPPHKRISGNLAQEPGLSLTYSIPFFQFLIMATMFFFKKKKAFNFNSSYHPVLH